MVAATVAPVEVRLVLRIDVGDCCPHEMHLAICGFRFRQVAAKDRHHAFDVSG